MIGEETGHRPGKMGSVALPIEQYALLGDTESAAIVGLDGSIDWLCLPRFDSAACFAALLGDERHGRWRLAPKGCEGSAAGVGGTVLRATRSYRPDTMVLDTEFTTKTGRVRLTDFMPPRDNRLDIMRRVEGVDGEVEMELDFVLRFDYGRVVPWVRRVNDADGRIAISAIAGPDAVCLRGDVLPPPVPTQYEGVVGHRHKGTFTVKKGETFDFSLTWFPSHEELPSEHRVDEQLPRTERYWRRWARRCDYRGPHRDAVLRSLLTLKALTYHPTGGIVAAPTTSLPEQLGGERNWDYRYCWLRDAALTLRALVTTGYRDEARDWRLWLLRSVAGDPADVQIMYGLGGERRLVEWTVDWLPGYAGSTPVRIGNGAYDQRQSDVYGEVLEALAEARDHGIAETDFSWPLQLALVDNLTRHWSEPDNGIWEVRGPRRHFVHSRVMTWVAFDRAIKAVEKLELPGPVDEWRKLRDEIHAEVCAKGWSEELGTFTQYYGGTTLDASLLLLAHTGFLPSDDPRLASTVAAVERELREGPLVWRYTTAPVHEGDTVDGLEPGEGAFLACSFWLVHAMVHVGRRPEAEALFEELLGLANDLGLYAEEYDPKAGCMVGNFPQAFSHLALVDAARALAETA